jgi:hypothetical protein
MTQSTAFHQNSIKPAEFVNAAARARSRQLQFATSSRAPSIKSDPILCHALPFSAVRVTVGYLQSIDFTSKKLYRRKTPHQPAYDSRASSHQTARLLQWLHLRWLYKMTFFPHRPSSCRFIPPQREALPDGHRHFPCVPQVTAG